MNSLLYQFNLPGPPRGAQQLPTPLRRLPPLNPRGGGVLSKATDVCVSGLSRACDGLPSGGCGRDGGLRDCQAGSIALVEAQAAQPRTVGKSRLSGSSQHTVELQRRQVAHRCHRQPAEGRPPDGCILCATTPQPARAGCWMAARAV